ncbi:DUF1800 domain-containing protein [Flavobacterium sp.]|jgi:uncharacterized protein (DUF1800 family)|uniref:DUF1800 domain-containing protein n=1 Tax=Flavobacterium sp. TaxID=239 RepID=UPI0022CAD2A0|nr:DUF1800 domain-containing protein [Flavobacterium sp.]MCZ8229288.1 DUF1800 domain-containing protein [Flavobacterium sp.]
MKKEFLWSQRLGFSNQEAAAIQKLGIERFLQQSFDSPFNTSIPELLGESPKSLDDYKKIRQSRKEDAEVAKELLKKEIQTSNELKAWWIDQMKTADFPLREKMTLFWQNHFVTAYQKVKVNYWIYQNNQLFRENAFGNFKTLTKKAIQTNAMVRYLDNVDNKKGKLNENLSRELLELFTLGIGNYSEDDIKNGAKGLAGLGIGETTAVYRRFFEDNSPIEYLGKKGNLKLEEMVDAIFDHPKIPYLLTRKIIKWFLYDEPKEDLVTYYGDYFRKVNFEIKPLLIKIFMEEFEKNDTKGTKIKNPLEYILLLTNELQTEKLQSIAIAFFVKQQGMDLFNPPNVKGWNGGKSWLTSQIYLQRNNAADLLCSGKNIRELTSERGNTRNIKPTLSIALDWNTKGTNKEIIKELTDRLLFSTDASLQQDLEKVLKYDFDPQSPGANNAVVRLFNAIIKSPEFQLI